MAGHKGATPKSHEEAERKTKRDPGVAVQVPAPAGGRAATATVLGGGSWGTALAHLVAQGGHRSRRGRRRHDPRTRRRRGLRSRCRQGLRI